MVGLDSEPRVEARPGKPAGKIPREKPTPQMRETGSKSGLARWGQNLLLVVISLALALGLVEVALRIYNPLGFRIKGDQIVLRVNKKEIIEYHDRKLDRFVSVTRNSLGFRGEEPPRDFGRWLTIVTVGGSTTECVENDDRHTWTYFLGETLQQDFHPLWINNAGLSGHSTYGHIILMKDYLAKLKPKVVVFLVGLNEVENRNFGEYDRERILRSFSRRSFRSLDSFLSALSGYSEAATAILNLKRYFLTTTTFARGHQETHLEKLGTLTNTDEFRAHLRQVHQEKYLGLYQQRLEELVKISREISLLPVFLTQPLLTGKAVDEVTGVDLGEINFRHQMNGETAWEILELYNQVTREVGRRDGILVIDLAREMPKSSKYFCDFTHYTNAGGAKVAEIVYEDLRPFLAQNFPDYQRGPKN